MKNPFASGFEFIEIGGESKSELFDLLKTAQKSYSTKSCKEANNDQLKKQIDESFKKLKEDIGLEATIQNPETKKVTKTEEQQTSPQKTVTETTEKYSSPANTVTWLDYLAIEQIINYMNQNNIYWIKIKNSKSGGNMRIKSNPIIDIFRGGSSVKFSGGSVAYFYILDNQNNIVLSGLANGYKPYEKSSQIGKN